MCTITFASCSAQPPSAQESLTPRITQGSVPADLKSRVLQTSDLSGIDGLTKNMKVAPIDSLNAFANPDPRGPCGAKVDQPDLAAGADVAWSGSSLQGFEAVVNLPEKKARSFLAAIADDSKPGCPTWHSTTNQSSTQTGEFLGVVKLNQEAATSTAANIRITVSGVSTYATELILMSGGMLAMVALFSQAPIDESTTRELATAAAKRLT